MKFSRLDSHKSLNLEGLEHNIWKDRVNQETNSYFSSIDSGLRSHKILPKSLNEIAKTELSTIRTASYMTIDQLYKNKILEKPEETQNDRKISPKRYNNYPWNSSSFQIAHDFSKKSVSSPKFIMFQNLKRKEAFRQSRASYNLYKGSSSINLLRKLPPLNKISKAT